MLLASKRRWPNQGGASSGCPRGARKSFVRSLSLPLLMLLTSCGEQFTSQTVGETEPPNAIPTRQQLVALKLESKTEPIELLVPSEFKTASTLSETSVRDNQLAALNSNPGRRTLYRDWMVYDWNAPEKMPWLMVASIGGLIERQGRIPQDEWNRLKTEMLSLQRKNLEGTIAVVERRIRDGAALNYEIAKRQVTDLFVSDSSSVTCVVDFVTETEFGSIDAWGAMKMVYTDRSVATVYVYVPKDHPDSLGVLQGLVQRVSVR
jgi:hypothetical protein